MQVPKRSAIKECPSPSRCTTQRISISMTCWAAERALPNSKLQNEWLKKAYLRTLFLWTFFGECRMRGTHLQRPWSGNTHTYMLLDERVAPIPLPTKDETLSILVRNYFRSHAPATLDDFCWWSELSVKEARLGVEIIEKEVQKVVFNDKTYLLHESSSIDIKEKERFIFLSAYDEYIIAYKYRGDVLQASHNSKAFTNGVFFPLILQNGRATGNWKMTLTRRNIAINTSYFDNNAPNKFVCGWRKSPFATYFVP